MSDTTQADQPASSEIGEQSLVGRAEPVKTVSIFAMELPVIADLGDGYYLVAHPNGPGIATSHSLATLELAVADPPRESLLFDDADDELDIPIHVGRKAIRAYVDWSWKQLQVPTV